MIDLLGTEHSDLSFFRADHLEKRGLELLLVDVIHCEQFVDIHPANPGMFFRYTDLHGFIKYACFHIAN